jgi:transcription elongation factor Elf1
MPERESNHLNYRRAEWLRTAVCPFCTESNRPPRTDIITINEDGAAVCGNCSKSWRPKV